MGGSEEARRAEAFAKIVAGARNRSLLSAVDAPPKPRHEAIVEILRLLRDVVTPGFRSEIVLTAAYLGPHVSEFLSRIHGLLSREIGKALAQQGVADDRADPADAETRARELATRFFEALPDITDLLADDVRAAFDGDPAATGTDEIILAYPGLKAVFTYRVAHALYELGVPLVPRMMTEFAHLETGVDIHPGARIGRSFFVDHGSGTVIGETTDIGARVKLYQGVTLGAVSFPKNERGELIRGTKRHPTVHDDVVIYAGATILGGETVIGKGCVIGGSVWLTSSVPPGTRVTLPDDQLRVAARGLPVASELAAK